jgi:hypothetical protein
MVALMGAGVLASWSGLPGWPAYLTWMVAMGLAYSAILTPSGRLLPRSSSAETRPTLYAARFALSHACWLVTYPLAGWLGAYAGYAGTLGLLGLAAAAAALAALWLWPAHDPVIITHDHAGLPHAHPHLAGQKPHSHAYVIDDLHPAWPALAT